MQRGTHMKMDIRNICKQIQWEVENTNWFRTDSVRNQWCLQLSGCKPLHQNAPNGETTHSPVGANNHVVLSWGIEKGYPDGNRRLLGYPHSGIQRVSWGLWEGYPRGIRGYPHKSAQWHPPIEITCRLTKQPQKRVWNVNKQVPSRERVKLNKKHTNSWPLWMYYM